MEELDKSRAIDPITLLPIHTSSETTESNRTEVPPIVNLPSSTDKTAEPSLDSYPDDLSPKEPHSNWTLFGHPTVFGKYRCYQAVWIHNQHRCLRSGQRVTLKNGKKSVICGVAVAVSNIQLMVILCNPSSQSVSIKKYSDISHIEGLATKEEESICLQCFQGWRDRRVADKQAKESSSSSDGKVESLELEINKLKKELFDVKKSNSTVKKELKSLKQQRSQWKSSEKEATRAQLNKLQEKLEIIEGRVEELNEKEELAAQGKKEQKMNRRKIEHHIESKKRKNHFNPLHKIKHHKGGHAHTKVDLKTLFEQLAQQVNDSSSSSDTSLDE